MNKYKCLDIQKFTLEDYVLIPIRQEDIESIRKWRNAQIDILRQNKPISKNEQEEYYEKKLKKNFYEDKPEQIIFSFLLKNECIGYGGFVHIDWKQKSAELSFLNETGRSKKMDLYFKDFSKFLIIISKIAFNHIKFKKLVTETYNIRPKTIQILKDFGFKNKDTLKNHVKINGDLIDSLIFNLENN
jgi:RimJ/RimL family protein N-acetyltransferase